MTRRESCPSRGGERPSTTWPGSVVAEPRRDPLVHAADDADVRHAGEEVLGGAR
ncbi:hypothetical protein ACIGNX_11920 [Actinosynnema sp. NPDC053489]|uniref:hypothetical protein n=1 Tax=Actinosynnema sp. NPDC053489 TaxID=3363916 RepID=UPI0037CB2404